MKHGDACLCSGARSGTQSCPVEPFATWQIPSTDSFVISVAATIRRENGGSIDSGASSETAMVDAYGVAGTSTRPRVVRATAAVRRGVATPTLSRDLSSIGPPQTNLDGHGEYLHRAAHRVSTRQNALEHASTLGVQLLT